MDFLCTSLVIHLSGCSNIMDVNASVLFIEPKREGWGRYSAARRKMRERLVGVSNRMKAASESIINLTLDYQLINIIHSDNALAFDHMW